jgi:uncharacterized protein YwgA
MNLNIYDRIVKNITDLELLILALLYADNKEGIKGDLFLQKELFLVVNLIKEMKSKADFIAHFLGPYSEPIEQSLRNLLSYKLVEKRGGKYCITQSGTNVFEELQHRLSRDHLEAIEDFKLFLNDLFQDELLVFIYCSFPAFTTESTIKREIFKKRLPVAIGLYKKGKVSLEKAASLSGISLEDLIDIMRDHNEDL